MGYCHIHGEYIGSAEFGCPKCQEAQGNTEEALSAIVSGTLAGLARQEKSDAKVIAALHEINNPGEYQCPACRLKTLITGASRCPRCQKDIEHSFWEAIWRQEEIERARQERERAEQAARAAEEARLRRIEEEKRTAERAAAEEKQRIRNLRILRVVVIGAGILGLLWLCTNEVLLMVHRHEFKKAISHKQIDQARALSFKLGERYYTTGDLEALQNFMQERAAFERLLDGQRELLAKYGGDEWNMVQAKVREAEQPGLPTISAQAYLEAARLVKLIKSRLSDMLTAQSTFSKDWEENADALKQFDPATYAKLAEGANMSKG
jgi:uncharacterized Zn finger protein (UPF0148 family)